MNDKTVTMDYAEHEKMIKEFKEMKEAKLCVLNIVQHRAYPGGMPFFLDHFRLTINSNKELKEQIESLIEQHNEMIKNPLKEIINKISLENGLLQKEIKSLKQELEKSKQRKWKFWK